MIKKFRPTIPKVLGAALLVLCLWLAWWFLVSGKLSVTAPPNVEVSLVRVGEGRLVREAIGSGTFSKRLRAGQYTVIGAKENGESTRLNIDIKPRKTAQAELDTKPLRQPQEILSGSAHNIVTNGSRFRFLDKNLSLIYGYESGSAKATPLFYELYPTTRVTWQNMSNALVETRDNHFVIENDKVRRFKYPPGDYLDNVARVASYDINARGELVIILDGQIYFYERFSAEPVKIFETGSSDMSVRLSEDGKIFAHVEAFVHAHSEEGEADTVNLLLDRRGKQLNIAENIKNGDITYANWGPDNTKLLMELDGQVYIYDTSAKTTDHLLQYPPQNIESTRWLDSNQLLFIVDDALWRLTTGLGRMEKITGLPSPVKHRDAMTVHDGMVYFSTSAPGGFSDSGTLYKVRY